MASRPGRESTLEQTQDGRQHAVAGGGARAQVAGEQSVIVERYRLSHLRRRGKEAALVAVVVVAIYRLGLGVLGPRAHARRAVARLVSQHMAHRPRRHDRHVARHAEVCNEEDAQASAVLQVVGVRQLRHQATPGLLQFQVLHLGRLKHARREEGLGEVVPCLLIVYRATRQVRVAVGVHQRLHQRGATRVGGVAQWRSPHGRHSRRQEVGRGTQLA